MWGATLLNKQIILSMEGVPLKYGFLSLPAIEGSPVHSVAIRPGRSKQSVYLSNYFRLQNQIREICGVISDLPDVRQVAQEPSPMEGAAEGVFLDGWSIYSFATAVRLFGFD